MVFLFISVTIPLNELNSRNFQIMENSVLKEKLHHLVDSADTKLLEILYSVASEFHQTAEDLTPEQLAELKRRLDLFDAGKMSFSTWDEMISKIENE